MIVNEQDFTIFVVEKNNNQNKIKLEVPLSTQRTVIIMALKDNFKTAQL